MLGDKRAVATLSAIDIKRAINFYKDTLGLRELRRSVWDVSFEAGEGSVINLYQRSPSNAEHTQLTFHVDDLPKEVADLKGRGVVFEDYDLPEMGIKTQDSIAEMDGVKMAWFKDSEGNIVGVLELK